MSIGIAWGSVEKVGQGRYRLGMDTGILTLRAVEGLEKLVYEVIFVMFTTVGAIADLPNLGSYLNGHLGGLLVDPSGSGLEKVRQELTMDVIRIQDQIKANQIDAKIPDEEKLGSIVLDEIVIDRSTMSAELKVAVINILGQSASVSVPKVLQS